MPAAKRERARRDWCTRTERQSLRLHPLLLREARANSRAARDPAFLMGLAREIALARQPELTLAYGNVVMVTAGFKKRSRGGREMLTRTPCVVFVVRHKWDAPAADEPQTDEPEQRLPRWLVTFAEREGRRLPFALPTDVQLEAGFAGAQAHAASVWIEPPGFEWEHGAVGLAVRVTSDEGSETCLMSAQHVFTPRADVDAFALQGELPLRPLDAQGARRELPLVAHTLPWGGLLRGEEDPLRPSFDVQLARIASLPAARAVVGALRLHEAEPWVRTPERLWALAATRWFHLLVPKNHPEQPGRAPLRAQLDAPLTHPVPIRYALRRGAQRAQVLVYHDELLKLQVADDTLPLAGDSGCALVVRQSGGRVTLAGLYIGGEGRAAYAIPAWQLFDTARWWSHPAGATLAPVSL